MNRVRIAAAAGLALALAASGPAPRAGAAGPTPVVSSVAPGRGPIAGGTTVTITGTDFAAPAKVTFGGTLATSVVVVNPTTITCITPAHAKGPVDVVVTQTTPPETPSAPLVGGFAYDDPPYYVWIPRAPGSATGGNPGGWDVTVVDVPNRRVVAKIDLNPADVLLPNDDDWSVTQVLFDPTGATAFLATSGTPGARDSRKIFVVDTALALDANPANDVLSTIDTGGNPYQLAHSSAGLKLHVADGGSWAGSAINLPDGTFRSYDVTNRAAPVQSGTSVTVGKVPMLHWDGATQRGWGTNSSHLGRLQGAGVRTVVTNAVSRTLSVVNLNAMTAAAPIDVAGAVSGGFTTSIPSPFQDDFLFVETVDPTGADGEYFVFRISTSTLIPKGAVDLPVEFQALTLLPAPRLDLQNRRAWPHPDGESLYAIPAADASVAAWKPASGVVPEKAAIIGGGPPSTLAFNDATDFLYAREVDGGWTVYEMPDGRNAAPVKSVEIADATGIDSLRVVGDGSELVGTGASTLAFINGKVATPDLHKAVATLPLDLDPAGGPSFPQPGVNGGAARTFVTLQGDSSAPSVVFPVTGSVFCADDAPPEFTITLLLATGAVYRDEIEIGSQRDFLSVPGAKRFRIRVPAGSTTATPPVGPWLRVLRAAAGDVERPFYARGVRVFSDGTRLYGQPNRLLVCEPDPPVPTSPADTDTVTLAVPPEFTYTPGDAGRFWIEFLPNSILTGSRGTLLRVRGDVSGPASLTPSPRAWRRVVDRALGKAGSLPEVLEWRVRCIDVLGRETHSEVRSLYVDE